VVLVCFLVACGGELRGAISLRLSPQGYSPITKTLLIHSADANSVEGPMSLMAYDEISGSVKRVASPGRLAPADWAWVPGRAAFIGVDLEQVLLFQRDMSGDGYTATAIPGLDSGLFPLQCSWSPTGQWLAVNCLSRANVTRGELWLYKFGDKALRKAGVALDHGATIWQNDALFYGTKGNAVQIVKLIGEKPSVVRTVPVSGRLAMFYGMFSEEPLFLSSGMIRHGDYRILGVLDRPSAKFRVIGTEKIIFVSASPGHLAAFGTAGNQIATSDPGRLIRFGSVKDPNTVYGLADSSLVCVSVEKGVLKIQAVADLGSLTGTEEQR